MENGELPKLIINLDINRTIIFKDAAMGQNTEKGVKSILCDMAWGDIDKETNHWKLYNEKFSLICPKKGLITYKKYIKSIYKSKTPQEINDKTERLKINIEIEAEYTKKLENFFNEGEPGESLKESLNEILLKLKVPESVMKEINKEHSKYKPIFKELYEESYVFSFLSLFRMMIELKEKDRNFAVVFRSFGHDCSRVIDEFNSFCEGRHPMFSGDIPLYPQHFFDGTHGSKDYRLKKENIGMYYRYDEDIHNTYLILGTLNRLNPKPNDPYIGYKNELYSGDVEIIQGGSHIFNFIVNCIHIGRFNSFLFNDDYSIWGENDQKKEFGKPLFINPYDKNIHQIFFDDNITDNDTSIVDCRNIVTGKTMPMNEINEKYVVINNAISAATDEYYFLKCIEKAEEFRKIDLLEPTIDKNLLHSIVDEGIEKYKNEFIKNKGKLCIDFTQFIANYIVANKRYINHDSIWN